LAKALFSKGCTSNGRTFNVCFAVKQNRVIAIGINNYNQHVRAYNKRLGYNYKKFGSKTYTPCVHAEVSAILKLGLEDCSKISFYNVRLDRNGHCKNSQPCANCLYLLNSVQAKNVYCYDDDLNICRVSDEISFSDAIMGNSGSGKSINFII
jgi:deoxycytidylate deaminase